MFRALRSRAAVRTLHLLLATPSTFAACGCGGGGGGGTAVAPQNAIALAFPPPHCLTDDPRFELRGTTVRPDRVANITANGFPAASSDRFATWSIDVALGAATTPFDIEAVDGNGARLSSSNCTVEFAALPESPGDIAVDPSRKQILIADFFNPRGLLALDLTTGRTAVASGKDRGIGPPLADGVDAVAVDDANDRAFTLEGNLGQIQSIDLRNGNRTMLSDFLSAGVKFDRPTDLELDVARKRLVVADLGLDALLAVSLTDGSRSILSDATHGSGPALDRPERLALVAGLDVALVITRGSDDLFAVKLSNGDRSIVSGASRGSGPAFRFMNSVAFDPKKSIGLVANGDGTLLRVDLDTGDRKVIASDDQGKGPPVGGIVDVSAFGDGSAAIVSRAENSILTVDLDTGNRDDLETLRVGSGTRITNVQQVTADPASRTCFIVEAEGDAVSLRSVDARTGDRTLISSPERGSGPLITNPAGLAVVASRNTAFVSDLQQRAIFAVDLTTGDRTIVSDSNHGIGVPLSDPFAIAVDDGQDLAFVTDFDFSGFRLVAIDLSTGDRSEFSGQNRGSGPDLGIVRSIAIEKSGSSVLLLDGTFEVLVRIDLVTGDRSFASGEGVGDGPDFGSLFTGFELSSDATHALVNDRFHGLVDVDLASGDRRVLFDPELTLGPGLTDLSDFNAGDDGLLFGVGAGGTALVVVDLATGNRVVISH